MAVHSVHNVTSLRQNNMSGQKPSLNGTKLWRA